MKETFAEFQQDWTQLFGGFNWYTFRFCQIEFEWDKMMGGVEFTLVVLGIGVRVRHNYEETETMIKINQQVNRIVESEEQS